MGSRMRRANGEGLVRQRPDGRWEARVDAGGPNGYRVRKSIYGRTKAELTAKLRQTTLSLERGHSVTDERMTVETFLTTWLSDVVQPAKRHSTWQGYSVNVNRHLLPLIGRRTLAKLSPADVQAVINAKRREGLSPRTVQYIHATLRAALGVALRWGMVDRNVATLVEPIQVRRPPAVPFSPDEVKKLLQVTSLDRLSAFWTVALAVGLRPSEALGLRWSDVDFDNGRLFVRHTLEHRDGGWSLQPPKSQTSRRTIPLPSVCVAALRAHQGRQEGERAMAFKWEEHDLVFTNEGGAPLSRTLVSHRFSQLQKQAGIRHHRLYDCRHTAASLLLAQGVAARVVMEVLGHSSYALTMDTYTHVLPTLMRDAADAMDRSFDEF